MNSPLLLKTTFWCRVAEPFQELTVLIPVAMQFKNNSYFLIHFSLPVISKNAIRHSIILVFSTLCDFTH